jgi:hypothetical protein
MNWQRVTFAILAVAVGAFALTRDVSEMTGEDAKAQKKALRLKLKQEADAAAKTQPEPAKPVAKVAPAETRPAKPMDAKAVAQLIDAEINKKLAEAKLAPSGRSSDAEFIRRATLDITGVIPAAERVESFLADIAIDKRARLIDELLASPKYGQRLSDIWTNQMVPMDSALRFTSKDPLVKWMADNFNANKPWDRMAHDLLTAAGDQDKNGAVTYFMVNQGVDKMTDSVGKLFLGVQIQCAQCHNHPFTHWKQDEYWGLAQFFYNVNVVFQRNNKQTDITPGVSEVAFQKNRKGNPLPESAKSVPAKFLGAEVVTLTSSKPYRPVLADWVCAAENPFFSKSMVNRVWAQYFGRGIVNPVDDMSDENEPTHPELLAQLSKEFSSGGFDLKNLVRAICLSDAYQRASQPTSENKQDETLYSHMAIKVMTPEQLFDSLTAVTGGLGDGGKGAGKTPISAPVSRRARTSKMRRSTATWPSR